MARARNPIKPIEVRVRVIRLVCVCCVDGCPMLPTSAREHSMSELAGIRRCVMCPYPNASGESDDNDTTGGVDHDGVVVPLPRKAPDDDVENLPRIAHEQDVWCYDQKQNRGLDRRFSGHINRVDGAEGERVRGELAAVIRDLVYWAAEQQPSRDDESIEDGDAA